MPEQLEALERALLQELEQTLASRAEELAVFLVFDRPSRVDERPGVSKAFFAQRCVSDIQLNQMIDAFRTIGAYVELFEGERPLLEALVSGRVQALPQRMKIIYNGIEGGIAVDGFKPGRKSLIPAVADSYGIACSNSNAYACALGRHKFHYFTLLRSLGVPTPRVWHYRMDHGWAGGLEPPEGTTIIAKSTYESWSVGVTDKSVFTADRTTQQRVEELGREIGQSVTVQEFVSGTEVCVPVFATPQRFATRAVEVILRKAPGDADAVMTIDDNLESGAVSYRPFAPAAVVAARLRNAALAAFDVLELDAFARIDFRVDSDGHVWVIDVGVSPGLSTASSAYCSVADLGFDHPSFVRIVVAATLSSVGLLSSSPSRIPPPAS